MTLILAIVLIGLCGLVDAQLTRHFTAGDLTTLQTKAAGVLSSPKFLQGASYAVKALKSSGSSVSSCNCNALQELLSASDAAYDSYYAQQIDEECKCGLQFKADVAELARKDMQVMFSLSHFIRVIPTNLCAL